MSDDTNTLPSNAPDQVFADATQLMGASKEVMIDVAGVDKFFGEFQALKNINMRVGQQEVVVVIGPSGSGKSTLIRCINRLEKHDRGQILVGGVSFRRTSATSKRSAARPAWSSKVSTSFLT